MDTVEVRKEHIKLSRWKVFGLLIISAFITIFYVSNVLAIDSLLEKIQELNKQLDNYNNSNELFKVEIIRLESAERIIPLAEKELGMVKPVEPPIVIPNE